MRTQSQKQAARINGAKSRGAITPEGKLASSRNAMTHGLLSGTIVLNGESEERFNTLLADLHAELQPQTTVEMTLVENMAVARWRQMRIWGMEKAGMEHEMRAQAGDATEDTATRCALAFRALSDNSRSLELINRYEARYDRQYLRAHHRFMQLVDRRTPPPAPAPDKPAAPGPQLVSAKQTREGINLIPSHRLAAVACALTKHVGQAVSLQPPFRRLSSSPQHNTTHAESRYSHSVSSW
jgi:hypothetical protein